MKSIFAGLLSSLLIWTPEAQAASQIGKAFTNAGSPGVPAVSLHQEVGALGPVSTNLPQQVSAPAISAPTRLSDAALASPAPSDMPPTTGSSHPTLDSSNETSKQAAESASSPATPAKTAKPAEEPSVQPSILNEIQLVLANRVSPGQMYEGSAERSSDADTELTPLKSGDAPRHALARPTAGTPAPAMAASRLPALETAASQPRKGSRQFSLRGLLMTISVACVSLGLLRDLSSLPLYNYTKSRMHSLAASVKNSQEPPPKLFGRFLDALSRSNYAVQGEIGVFQERIFDHPYLVANHEGALPEELLPARPWSEAKLRRWYVEYARRHPDPLSYEEAALIADAYQFYLRALKYPRAPQRLYLDYLEQVAAKRLGPRDPDIQSILANARRHFLDMNTLPARLSLELGVLLAVACYGASPRLRKALAGADADVSPSPAAPSDPREEDARERLKRAREMPHPEKDDPEHNVQTALSLLNKGGQHLKPFKKHALAVYHLTRALDPRKTRPQDDPNRRPQLIQKLEGISMTLLMDLLHDFSSHLSATHRMNAIARQDMRFAQGILSRLGSPDAGEGFARLKALDKTQRDWLLDHFLRDLHPNAYVTRPYEKPVGSGISFLKTSVSDFMRGLP